MKKIIRRVQSLGQKATELREAMEKLPPKVAEIRQAFTMTTGQLQQLREDVQSSVADLKADSEDSLSGALHEINGSVEVFRQAGYELSGVDMDLSINRRLMVHLNKMAEIRESVLRGLLKANQGRKTTHGLLQSLMKADEVARETDLTNLTYRALVVQVGAVPSVRMCWRADEVFEEETEEEKTAGPQPPPIPTGEPTFGKESFFGPRASASPTPIPAETKVRLSNALPATPLAQPVVASRAEEKGVAPPEGTPWKRDSLERFKTNPHYSKYRK